MSKLFKFLNKPKNIYLSMVVMLTIVTALLNVSFSYYIDESKNDTKTVYLKPIENKINSEDLVDNDLVVNPLEEKTIILKVESNNNFPTRYKVYYEASENVLVTSNKTASSEISSYGENIYKVTIKNMNDTLENISFGIESGYINNEITLENRVLLTDK